jgi:alginate O-acetyltransferase complex protein AlgJ
MTRPLRKLYVALFIGILALLFVGSIRSVLSYRPPAEYSVLDGQLGQDL